MAEGTYEYECNRAELLGLAEPDRAEWEVTDKARKEAEEIENLTEIANQDEQIRETLGKMDDLNNILSITQMRLNKFKKACGSLTNLLKLRGADGERPDSPLTAGGDEASGTNVDNELDRPAQPETSEAQDDGIDPSLRKTSKDISHQMSSQLGKLDSLLTKADNAHYAMQSQNKQIKSYLK